MRNIIDNYLIEREEKEKEIRKFPRRKISPEQLAKELDKIEDEIKK